MNNAEENTETIPKKELAYFFDNTKTLANSLDGYSHTTITLEWGEFLQIASKKENKDYLFFYPGSNETSDGEAYCIDVNTTHIFRHAFMSAKTRDELATSLFDDIKKADKFKTEYGDKISKFVEAYIMDWSHTIVNNDVGLQVHLPKYIFTDAMDKLSIPTEFSTQARTSIVALCKELKHEMVEKMLITKSNLKREKMCEYSDEILRDKSYSEIKIANLKIEWLKQFFINKNIPTTKNDLEFIRQSLKKSNLLS